MKTAKNSDRATSELLENALALSKHNVLSAQELNQIKRCAPRPLCTQQKKWRSSDTHKAKMSQAVFADFLNVTPSIVPKWEFESSSKHPGGATAKLLQLIEKKGIEAIAV